jgi:hypothetical protein
VSASKALSLQSFLPRACGILTLNPLVWQIARVHQVRIACQKRNKNPAFRRPFSNPRRTQWSQDSSILSNIPRFRVPTVVYSDFRLFHLQIARVRQENIARQKRQQEELAAAQEEARRSSGGAASTPGAGSILLQGATLARTLKVTWDRLREGGVEDYGAEKLRKVFTQFGPVEDVIIKEDVKKKKKGSALVVVGTEGAAAAAIGSVCGDLSNPLLVKPAVPGMVPSAGQANAANGPQANGVQAGGENGELANGVNRGQKSGVNGRQTSDVNVLQDGGVHRSQTSGVNGAQDGGASGDGEEREDIHGAGAAPQGKPSTSSEGGASQVCSVPDSPRDLGFCGFCGKLFSCLEMKCGPNLGARISFAFRSRTRGRAVLVTEFCGYQYLLLGCLQPVRVTQKGKLSVAFGFSAS